MHSTAFASALVLVLGSLIQPSLCQSSGYCLASDYEPYLKFGSKTAYEFVKGRQNSQHTAFGCEPIMFWSFNRPGTRLPGQTTIDELPRLAKIRDDIISNYEIKRTAPDRGRLCEQDINNLKSWVWNKNFTMNVAGDLTSQGYDDLRYLAKRWQSKFQNLLPTQYNMRHYLLKHTDKRRATDSFRAFVDGLFGRENVNRINSQEAISNDSLLSISENCPNWNKEVKDKPSTQEQVNTFKGKQEFREMIQNVSSHLGYKYDLDQNIIKNMYDMCRYDKAWEVARPSPWCAAFTKEQLRLLEYHEDLKTYYESGYGNEFTKKQGCVPLKDMMDRFTRMIEHPELDQQRAVFYFTHSKMFLPLLTALGIAEDSVPLLADNYHTPNIQRRLWSSSRLSPFAANLVAILHRCQNSPDGYKVMFLINETPVEFRDCQVGLCSWDTVKSKYAEIVKNCRANPCYESSANALSNHKWHIAIGTIVTVVLSKLAML